MAKQLVIWLDRSLGSAFESKLYAAGIPDLEFERREATTYVKRQQIPWLTYHFYLEDHDLAKDLMLIAKEVNDRYQKEVRFYEYAFQVHKNPLRFRGRQGPLHPDHSRFVTGTTA